MNRYRLSLVLVFVAIWIWAAIRPLDPGDWLLENLLVFFFVPLILASGRYFRLSEASYTLIALFTCLHVVGSHYTYAEVPFGFTLQRWLDADRNMYDRLVHFCFGLLLAYPVREVFLRVARVKGFWGFYLPFDVILSLSALYEIMEWLVAVRVDPKAGLAFLGTQGDIWDTQKDMLAAATGALLAMLAVAVLSWKRNPEFAAEMRSSFRLHPAELPADERTLGPAIESPDKPGRKRR